MTVSPGALRARPGLPALLSQAIFGWRKLPDALLATSGMRPALGTGKGGPLHATLVPPGALEV